MKKYLRIMLKMMVIGGLALLLAMPSSLFAKGPPEGKGPEGGGHETEAGNNLSFPVIWADGVAKNLPGDAGMDPLLEGEWWYQWGANGVEPNIEPASCQPDPDELDIELNPEGLPLCDDGIAGFVDLTLIAGEPVADKQLPLVKAYLQKDEGNVWQAESADWSTAPVYVDWIDWGDNLESVDWYTRSQVRTEVVLFQDLTASMTEYGMRHTSGWGIDEAHGLACSLSDELQFGDGMQATVYSHCARLIIQKLLVDRDDPRLADLIWQPGAGWIEPDGYEDDLINPDIFNKAVYEGGDGPGYYSAEINVKGRVIYGYTWNVRDEHDITGGTAAGDYRITFSLDELGPDDLNTFFMQGITDIIVPTEEELESAAVITGEEPGGGGEAELVSAEFDEDGNLIGGNLTYMDIRIHERSGGGNGPGGGGGGHRR